MRLSSIRCSALTLLVLFAGVLPSGASADAARLLGQTHLSRAENDKDVLRFAKCKRGINAIQLRVDFGQVEVERLWVEYAKGGRDVLPVRERIGKGHDSRWIDLRGGERCIKAIGIVGDTELSRDQARVRLWGR